MDERKIKKAVIREDLLSITNDYRKAILLNQFIYWSERVSDADKFIEKENEIAKSNGKEERELFYGWIYKTAEELADEVMLGLSASQIRRYINDLVDLGYLSKRHNPKYKWDRTLQYRVNLVNIARSLKEKGYPLSDYKIDIPDNENLIAHGCVINDEPEKNQSQSSERAIPDIINRNYNNINYNSENIKVDTLSKDNAEVDTSFPKKSLPAHEKKKTKSELKELESDMIRRFYNVGKQHDTSKLAFENILKAFCRYLDRYTECTGKVHPILKDETLEKIFVTLVTISDTEYNHFDNVADYEPDSNGISYLDEMVDEHFKAKHGDSTDWHISHFARSEYLEKMAQHIVEY